MMTIQLIGKDDSSFDDAEVLTGRWQAYIDSYVSVRGHHRVLSGCLTEKWNRVKIQRGYRKLEWDTHTFAGKFLLTSQSLCNNTWTEIYPPKFGTSNPKPWLRMDKRSKSVYEHTAYSLSLERRISCGSSGVKRRWRKLLRIWRREMYWESSGWRNCGWHLRHSRNPPWEQIKPLRLFHPQPVTSLDLLPSLKLSLNQRELQLNRYRHPTNRL